MKDSTAIILSLFLIGSAIIMFLSFRWCVFLTIIYSYIIIMLFLIGSQNNKEKYMIGEKTYVKNRTNKKLMDQHE